MSDIQGTESWMQERMGKVTASRVADVLARTKSGPAASRRNYMMQLLCERLTGTVEETFTSAAMMRGIDLEPIARSAYEVDQDVMVMECGSVSHPSVVGFSASPDGLVGDDGLLEIKCPNTAQHIAFLQTGMIDARYRWQMAAQMACTDRNWTDFVSFDDRLPEPLQYVRARVMRDDEKEAEMLKEVTAFLEELDALEAEMREKMTTASPALAVNEG